MELDNLTEDQKKLFDELIYLLCKRIVIAEYNKPDCLSLIFESIPIGEENGSQESHKEDSNTQE